MKTSIFIGSSSESLKIAEAIQLNLSKDPSIPALVVPWTQGVFSPGNYILEDLLAEIQKSQFAVFVFGTDDTVYSRKKKYATVRDNVLFEMGLFMGALGKDRVFFMIPKTDGYDYKKPSDLYGVTFTTYDPKDVDRNASAAVGPACTQIKEKMKAIGFASTSGEGIERFGDFPSFDSLSKDLLKNTNTLTTCFIHSGRWRQTNDKGLKQFIARKKSVWNVILPDVRDADLLNCLYEHFSDRRTLYAKIIDAYDYFFRLKQKYPEKVNIYLSTKYPTYSIYQFDNKAIVSLYPLSDENMPTPTFLIDTTTEDGQFFSTDINLIMSKGVTDDTTINTILESFDSQPVS